MLGSYSVEHAYVCVHVCVCVDNRCLSDTNTNLDRTCIWRACHVVQHVCSQLVMEIYAHPRKKGSPSVLARTLLMMGLYTHAH
jgi:hypothetical protein